MEDGSDVGRLPVGIAPLLVLLDGIMRHGVTFAPELEVEVTCRSGLDGRTGRAVSFERNIGGRILSGTVSRVKKPHTVAYPPVAV